MSQKAVKVYIGLGSNLGDGKTALQEAWQALGERDGIVLDKLSSPYMTAPVDMNSQHWFTNAVGRVQATLSPLEMLATLLEVESSLGRTRDNKSFGYQDRHIDLDLLYHGDVVMDNPELILPHPRIGDRLFVLIPLVEIEPDFRDIISGESVVEMRSRLVDSITASTSKKQEIICGTWSEQTTLSMHK